MHRCHPGQEENQWPHEGVFAADGTPAVCGDLTLTVFVWGYVMVLDMKMYTMVKAHMSQRLEELMEDTDLCGWIRVHSFQAAWLNEIEQGRSYSSRMQHCSTTPHLCFLWQELGRKLPSLSRSTMPQLNPAQRHVRTLTRASVSPMRIIQTPSTSALFA